MRLLPVLLVVGLALPRAKTADYAIGADLSFLKQAEDKGRQFKLDGKPEPALQIF